MATIRRGITPDDARRLYWHRNAVPLPELERLLFASLPLLEDTTPVSQTRRDKDAFNRRRISTT